MKLGFEIDCVTFFKALNPQELINLFSTCPVMPWGPDVYNTVPLNNHGYIGLQGRVSQKER